MSEAQTTTEFVTLTIDDQEVRVAKGTNLIEAAKQIGEAVPYYCYHPHLSVPGNCRMCQLEVEGAPKLMIGCHTVATEGMKVRTHKTSPKVEAAQASTLEMILINHPLDCTVCDQAGHCKLQDYHYEYNAKPSRFLEQKENKVKAQPLGPTVMLDGERCIACTRCVRFCDEITETGELGLLNRGDQYVISVQEGYELNNALSGTVVDLCPVGALTHKKWRFNTRLWYANHNDGVCPGCSTGCNVKVFERDGEIVQVKARLNSDVNKEWLCDEGRYGFSRFQPLARLKGVLEKSRAHADLSREALNGFATAFNKGLRGKTLVLLSPDLLVEDFAIVARYKEQLFGEATVVVAYETRELNDIERILVSPDYAANYRAAQLLGISGEYPEREYQQAIQLLATGGYESIVFLGDLAPSWQAQKDPMFVDAARKAYSVIATSNIDHPCIGAADLSVGIATILERSGLLVNKDLRLQYTNAFLKKPQGSFTISQVLQSILTAKGVQDSELLHCATDRDYTLLTLEKEACFQGLRLREIKGAGVCLRKHLESLGSAGEASLGVS